MTATKSTYLAVFFTLGLLSGCESGQGDTDSDTSDNPPLGQDPMVGEWEVNTLRNDGETVDYPTTGNGETTSYEWSFTEEPRGVLSLNYGATTETYEFVIDVFSEGRWMLEIEDGGHDMVQDCTADNDTMTCVGSCDGSPGCNWTLSRVD